jgi:hypothetical protein
MRGAKGRPVFEPPTAGKPQNSETSPDGRGKGAIAMSALMRSMSRRVTLNVDRLGHLQETAVPHALQR